VRSPGYFVFVLAGPSRILRLAATAGAICLVALTAAADGSADGDPASDVLLNVNVYLPAAPVAPPLSTLVGHVKLVNLNGYRLKVALIESPYDLGSIPSLFGHPSEYAKFLGLELRLVYSGNLLIVMPAGFGFWHHGRDVSREQAALDRVSFKGGSRKALVATTLAGVRAIVGRVGPTMAFAESAVLGSSTVRTHYTLMRSKAVRVRIRDDLVAGSKILLSRSLSLPRAAGVSSGVVAIVATSQMRAHPNLTSCLTVVGARRGTASCVRVGTG
jgi:hypothetical protein